MTDVETWKQWKRTQAALERIHRRVGLTTRQSRIKMEPAAGNRPAPERGDAR